MMVIGCGGVTQPGDALTLRQAGAELIELYSGMIYAGPGLPAGCARVLKESRT
jgi:dihydroorotate dehydrogenase